MSIITKAQQQSLYSLYKSWNIKTSYLVFRRSCKKSLLNNYFYVVLKYDAGGGIYLGIETDGWVHS